MGRITRLCDNAIALESFKGSERETNPLYKDYHGKNIHIHQSFCLFSNKVHTRMHIHTGSALRLGLGCGWRQGSPLAGQAVSACQCAAAQSDVLLSRQARGDSAATLYPLCLVPSPPPSLPQPSPQQSLSRLAPSPFPVPSHTPEALEQSRPTLGNRYSHHHSLSLSNSISLSLTQCLPGQHALLINGVSVRQQLLVGNSGRKWSKYG